MVDDRYVGAVAIVPIEGIDFVRNQRWEDYIADITTRNEGDHLRVFIHYASKIRDCKFMPFACSKLVIW